jgi:hypothetical protein
MMVPLYCHCGRQVATWPPPPGRDGGTVAVRCKHCPTDCPECDGLSAIRLLFPIWFVYPAALRRLLETLLGRES